MYAKQETRNEFIWCYMEMSRGRLIRISTVLDYRLLVHSLLRNSNEAMCDKIAACRILF